MNRFLRLFLPLLLALPLATAPARGDHDEPRPAAAGAPALDPGLGDTHFEITTKVPEAQKYFDQGIRLMHAFNPEEAERSFREAARLDPSCAMAEWGVALSNGNNINLPRLPWRDSIQYVHAQKALAMKAGASPRERALIEALAVRTKAVPPATPAEGSALDRAYAQAMRGVAKQFPKDAGVLTLFAESMMNQYPWQLWTPDLKKAPVTDEVVKTLETAIRLAPRHLGANHLYIHAVEASGRPEKAEAAADRLVGRTPSAGHLLHMPSHIFERVGRYSEAAEVNRVATKADVAYFAQPAASMLYTPYLAHNRQFVAYVSMIEGRYGEALETARDAAGTVSLEMNAMMPGMDFFRTTPYAVEVKFGRWDDVLAEPAPPASVPYTVAYWRFARGMALAGKKNLGDAKIELDSLTALQAAIPEGATEGLNPARKLLEMCRQMLKGAMARARGDLDGAIGRYQEVVKMEATLQFNEPPDWLLFPRHDLGATLLQAGRAAEAEAVFRADLVRRRENGWALNGLEQALGAQKKAAAAAKVAERRAKAWRKSDGSIAVSAY